MKNFGHRKLEKVSPGSYYVFSRFGMKLSPKQHSFLVFKQLQVMFCNAIVMIYWRSAFRGLSVLRSQIKKSARLNFMPRTRDGELSLSIEILGCREEHRFASTYLAPMANPSIRS